MNYDHDGQNSVKATAGAGLLATAVFVIGDLNPLSPNTSDKHLISPYNITTWSHLQDMRINEMINKGKMSWCLHKFSQLVL